MVNIKFGKLKKNYARNTKQNWSLQLKQEVLELSSMGINAGMQCRDREQKKFSGNKTSTPVDKHVDILTISPR